MNTIILNQLISFDFFDNFDQTEPNLPGSEPDLELFFLHGWRSDKESWTALTHNLLKSEIFNSSTSENPKNLKLRLWRLDLPGFGASPMPKNPWNIDNYADLVAIFLKQKSKPGSQKILVGHSFGGRISIKLAARSGQIVNQNLANSKSFETQPKSEETLPFNSDNQEVSSIPAQIDQLILIGSAGFVNKSADLQVKKAIAKILKPIFGLKILQNLKKQIYQKILKSDDYLQTSTKQIFMNVIGEDLSQSMCQITVPTLLIYGDRDTETPPSFGQRMKNLIKNSQLEIISGAGHFAFVDEPKIVSNLIESFLVDNK